MSQSYRKPKHFEEEMFASGWLPLPDGDARRSTRRRFPTIGPGAPADGSDDHARAAGGGSAALKAARDTLQPRTALAPPPPVVRLQPVLARERLLRWLTRSGARCWRKLSVREVPFRRILFESRVPIRSDVFGEIVQQDLDFRRKACWPGE